MYIEKAGFGERLAAYLIDSVIVSLIAIVPAACVGVLAVFIIDPESRIAFTPLFMSFLITLIITSLGSTLYYGLMWSRTGQTLGKKLMGLQVVTVEGGLPGFWGSMGRAVIGYSLSSVVFNVGFLWMLWDDQQQTWHDKLFGTYVVKV
jgi:uncharacterized RDD family membrane protein YckC